MTGRNKGVIEDHFDLQYELEQTLAARGKKPELSVLAEAQPAAGATSFTRQQAPLGLGHAVWCAKPVVGNEPFFVHLADDLIDGPTPCLRQMAAVHAERGGSVLGVETVPRSETDKYGIVATDSREGRVSLVKQIVEKPRPQNAPSTLAVVGRYLLSPTIFAKLEQTGRGAGGEIQLTDAIADLLADEPVYAYEFEGRRYDCGSKLGYLQATVEYGLKHEALGEKFSEYLIGLAAKLK